MKLPIEDIKLLTFTCKKARRYIECDELLDELKSKSPDVRKLLNDSGILTYSKTINPYFIEAGLARILIDNSNSSPLDIGIVFTANGAATIENIIDYLIAMELPHD